MDINTLILIVILGVMVYAMLSHGQEKKSVAESKREQNISKKEELSQEEPLSVVDLTMVPLSPTAIKVLLP